ncbi:hypothetical protein CH372_16265 [Leptospira meyeri]|nr:hypothetical protein CH372_16265 [Leptospira meyeri]PKA24853.1 hypothetical protein CH381_18595 [Leptospira sp. mixed culture ATI2-C-A1]TGL12997.1 hypothetical protein EHQ50_14685 [Leptospira meyeri]TGM23642.1 hypothetical protein EHQ73_00935 [Leptospira meyeri]
MMDPGMDLTLFVWNNTIAILVVMFVCYLASFRQTILFIFVLAFTLFACIQFTFYSQHDSIKIMSFIKLMLLLPFGLGVVLTFAIFSENIEPKFLLWISRYINFAVVANIFVMVFSPDGGTYRGSLSRFVCLALLIWLLQEMAKKHFQTTKFDHGFFIFRSSPLQWIYCHAAYRIALLSLPTFDSLHYLLLEPLSLVVMFVLYRLQKKRYPLHYYFGFSDTLVATTLTVLMWYPIILPFEHNGPYLTKLQENQLDNIFIPIQLVVIVYALRAIFKNIKILADVQSSVSTSRVPQ